MDAMTAQLAYEVTMLRAEVARLTARVDALEAGAESLEQSLTSAFERESEAIAVLRHDLRPHA